MDRFDIIELAQNTMTFVYETFNGKVNYLDPYTRLTFVGGYLDKTTGIAKTTPFGYIYVSLEAFVDSVYNQKFIDIDQIRNFALEIILHELTHANQLIDYRYIKFNNGYREDIETQCVKQTCEYILSNIDYIRSLGLVVIPETYTNRLTKLATVEYLPKNPEVLVQTKLDSMIGKSYKDLNRQNISIHYTDQLSNHFQFDVCKDRIFINSQNLNDLGERLLNNKNFELAFLDNQQENHLSIEITQK